MSHTTAQPDFFMMSVVEQFHVMLLLIRQLIPHINLPVAQTLFMQHFSNTDWQNALFNVFDDAALLQDMAPTDSWDVMDQFPPDNSHDAGGGLIFNIVCDEVLSSSQEVQVEAALSMAPKYVYITLCLILKKFLD